MNTTNNALKGWLSGWILPVESVVHGHFSAVYPDFLCCLLIIIYEQCSPNTQLQVVAANFPRHSKRKDRIQQITMRTFKFGTLQLVWWQQGLISSLTLCGSNWRQLVGQLVWWSKGFKLTWWPFRFELINYGHVMVFCWLDLFHPKCTFK